MKRTVTKVIDGDTFMVNRKINGTNYVRLANVNAPEKYQFGGTQATNSLKRLIAGETVTLIPRGMSYNRIVADVRVNRISMNKRLK